MNDWPTKKLGEVCKVNPTKSEIKDIPDDTFVSFVPMSAVSETSQRIEEQEDRKLSDVKKGYTYFRKGDILFAKITPCMENGKVALTDNLKNKIGFASTEFHVIRAGGEILPDYIFHLIASKKFRDEAKTKMTGSAGQKRVPKSFLENYTIPLPPLSQQKKIVARVEGVLGKIKEAKGLRAEAQKTPQNLLPAELHRIFSQPVRQAQGKQHTNKLEYVGMSGKSASVKNYGEAQWEEKNLEEICEKTTNIKWSDHKNNNFQYVDLTSVSRDDFSIAETKEVNSKNAPSRAKKVIKTNDVIFGTTRPTLMRVTRIPEEFNNHICSTGFTVLRAKKERVLPQFIYYFIRSERFMNRMESVQTGASYPAVSDAKVMETKIPLPPVAEQKKIVARLDSLSEKISSLRQAQAKTASDFISLEQSILSKSFQ